nr:unnamed protein product [Digitaria exilis]
MRHQLPQPCPAVRHILHGQAQRHEARMAGGVFDSPAARSSIRPAYTLIRGNAVLLYASKYNDVPIIVNISGRFALERGELEYRVSKASLEDRLSTDTLHSSRAISKDCRVLTIHGAKDEIVPAEDARQFAANIPNHELRIMAEANHRYTGHEQELTSLVLGFVRPHLQSASSPLRPKL